MADPRGDASDTHPGGSKCFQFHAVFGKIWQNRMLAPPPLPRVSAPISGKFWIHHWIVWSIVCEGPSGGVTAADTTTSWHDPSSFYVILISLFDFQTSNQHRIFAVLLLLTSTLRSVQISTSQAHRFLSMDFRQSRLEISSSWMDYHYGRHCSFCIPQWFPPHPRYNHKVYIYKKCSEMCSASKIPQDDGTQNIV